MIDTKLQDEFGAALHLYGDDESVEVRIEDGETIAEIDLDREDMLKLYDVLSGALFPDGINSKPSDDTFPSGNPGKGLDLRIRW